MKINIRNVILILTIGLLLVAAVLFVLELLYPKIRSGKDFRLLEFERGSYFLYDLGITDINSDSYLDIFTSNHFAKQNIWFGSNSGFGKAPIDRLGISPDLDFLGIENMEEPPKKEREALYIYWHKFELVIENLGKDPNTLHGQIELPSTVDSRVDHGTAEIKSTHRSGITSLEFTMEANSQIIIQPDLVAVPVTLTLSREEYSTPILVGDHLSAPAEDRFTFFLKDRHGIAWHDRNGDGILDFFVARGGLKGRMEEQPDSLVYKDELFVSNAGALSYREQLASSKWNKRGCSMHQVAWVDVNADGLMDLYATCRRKGQKNQLFIAQGDSFVESAGTFNLDFDSQWKGPFLWIDTDNDADQDLLIENNGAIWLYKNSDGRFMGHKVPDSECRAVKFAVADVDNDSDFDVFVSAVQKSLLLTNKGGSFNARNPKDFGLPSSSYSANWVDYDNDGLKDLHVLPGGIFRQANHMQFVPTNQLSFIFDIAHAESRTTWFDMDNDGDRDVVMAVKYKPSFWETILSKFGHAAPLIVDWHLSVYENLTNGGNWLQIELRQIKGNPSIVGAEVKVKAGQSKWWSSVGESEGSHYSQGHYRQYFGLGNLSSLDSVKIMWPDGSKSSISEPKINNIYVAPAIDAVGSHANLGN